MEQLDKRKQNNIYTFMSNSNNNDRSKRFDLLHSEKSKYFIIENGKTKKIFERSFPVFGVSLITDLSIANV